MFMKKLREILAVYVDDAIRKKGHEYFMDNAVTNLDYSEVRATALVKGSSLYDVEVIFGDDGFPLQALCTCPYNEKGTCKHVVAVLYELDSRNFFQMPQAYRHFHYSTSNSMPRGSRRRNEPVLSSREDWLNRLKEEKDAALFSEFKSKVSGLTRKNEKKRPGANFKIGYVINPQESYTSLRAVRLKPDKDGTSFTAESMYYSDFTVVDELPFAEKLLLQRLKDSFGEISVDLTSPDGYRSSSREQRLSSWIFSDILSFLSDRETFVGNHYEFSGKRVYIQNDPGSAAVVIGKKGNEISLRLRLYLNGEGIRPGTQIIPIM